MTSPVNFIHLEIVHPDPDAAAQFMRETLGARDVEPRMAAHLEGSVVPGLRVVHVMAGNVVFQFVKPVPELPSWDEQLGSQGPGVHNVTIAVSDPEATLATMETRGATLELSADVDLRPAGLEYDGDLKVYVIDALQQTGLRFEMFSTKAGWIGGEAP
jgi:catechol 2,3-dioxygenase-like lactoylglutathione lyase family enzyme